MDEHIGERVSTLEMEVAVIQSNYVRSDAFADLRSDVRIGFAQIHAKIDGQRDGLNARIDALHEEMSVKIEALHEEMNSRIDALREEINDKIEALRQELGAKIDKSTATLLKWMFASQFSVAALVLAAVKYL
jgi:DNA anti-recombination protein RmuC